MGWRGKQAACAETGRLGKSSLCNLKTALVGLPIQEILENKNGRGTQHFLRQPG